MTLICLEGPSAVGKTTTSKALADHYAAYIIPEVNQLFERPTPEPTYWYFERQLTTDKKTSGKLQVKCVIDLL
jgi:deoxyadenosine/deoxycytidine kinase